METEPQTTAARDQDLEPARRRRLRHRRTPRPGEGLLVPHRSRLQEPRRLHQPQARLLPKRPRHGPPDPMGHRRGQLVLLLAALAGIARPPASASANPVLVHITRTVTGESALLRPRPLEHQASTPAPPRACGSSCATRRPAEASHPPPSSCASSPRSLRRFPARPSPSFTATRTPKRTSSSTSHAEGRALDLRIANVDCTDIERFLVERPRLLARVGCFPNATFFHVDVGRSRGIWFDASVGLD